MCGSGVSSTAPPNFSPHLDCFVDEYYEAVRWRPLKPREPTEEGHQCHGHLSLY